MHLLTTCAKLAATLNQGRLKKSGVAAPRFDKVPWPSWPSRWLSPELFVNPRHKLAIGGPIEERVHPMAGETEDWDILQEFQG